MVTVAWYSGLGPSLVALVLGILSDAYFFMTPRYSLTASLLEHQIQVSGFLFLGLTIGLLNKGEWAAQLNVTEPGPFTVVIAPPRSGVYSVLLANALSGSLDTSIAITKLGIVHAP